MSKRKAWAGLPLPQGQAVVMRGKVSLHKDGYRELDAVIESERVAQLASMIGTQESYNYAHAANVRAWRALKSVQGMITER